MIHLDTRIHQLLSFFLLFKTYYGGRFTTPKLLPLPNQLESWNRYYDSSNTDSPQTREWLWRNCVPQPLHLRGQVSDWEWTRAIVWMVRTSGSNPLLGEAIQDFRWACSPGGHILESRDQHCHSHDQHMGKSSRGMVYVYSLFVQYILKRTDVSCCIHVGEPSSRSLP